MLSYEYFGQVEKKNGNSKFIFKNIFGVFYRQSLYSLK